MKKFFAIVLALAIISTFVAAFAGCKKEEPKKAMLLLHGIGEGCLYNSETDQPVFCITDFNTQEIGNLITGVISTDPNVALLDLLPVNEDGSLKDGDLIRPADMDDPTGQYVMANLMKPLYEKLVADYGDEYEVVIWQYDWRLHTDVIADKLEAYIASQGYEKIMLFTHSMGGLVASSFFKKESNRSMTELFVPFSTPFFGAIDTTYLMYEGLIAAIPEMINQFFVPIPDNQLIKSMLSLLDLEDEDYNEEGVPNPSAMFEGLMEKLESPAIKMLMGTIGIDTAEIFDIFKDLAKNLVSLYNLFPNEAFFDSPLYGDGSCFTYDGADKSYQEFLGIFETDPYLAAMTHMENDELKPTLANLTEYQESLMPNGEQISGLVNTFYVQGSGVKTLKTVNALSDGTASYDYFTYGDGLVSVWSGTAGLLTGDETEAELAALADKVYISDGGDGRTGTSHLFIIFADDVLEAVGNKVDATLAAIK